MPRKLKIQRGTGLEFDMRHSKPDQEMDSANKEPDTWTIITALSWVMDEAEGSSLSPEFWETCKTPLAYLRNELGLTDMQIVVMGMLVEAGEALSWKKMGNYLNVSRLMMMTYTEEIEEMLKKRWFVRRGTHELGGYYEGYALAHGVVTALRHNQAFVPEKIDGLTEQQFVDKLESHIDKNLNNFPSIQQRLEEEGMRKGFACLFYGGPGTGKTETVLQIARQTGRDLMQVDISTMRDKYVGESEKNIKQVFTRYRELCKNSDVLPILFFNEADALINKRTENIEHSVDKMDNAMQNILLQEIEDLDGILIATTNLTSNLDKAFERRFLFKIEFHKPTTDVKAKIWCSMLKDISADDAQQLAAHFDFSGGQIENIARKRTVDYILSGRHASLDDIEKYCQAELLDNKKERKHISGFSL